MKSRGGISFSNIARRVFASTIALTVVMQNFAWAVCTDGSSLPAGGYTIGVAPVQHAANWSLNVFTAAAGSLWIPDTSVNEHNDPTQPLTGGGHNWVFDQGSTLCKVTDTGPAGQTSTGWEIPPNNPTDCVILPVIKAGQVTNLGDIPYQGDAITPTCDPSLLSQPGLPNPANTYLNQLGCSISHGVATTAATATSFLFVAGIKGGLFSIPLDNVGAPAVGGSAGKTVGPQNYYSQIPEGTLLTNAAVSKDGQFAIATSIRWPTTLARLSAQRSEASAARKVRPSSSAPISRAMVGEFRAACRPTITALTSCSRNGSSVCQQGSEASSTPLIARTNDAASNASLVGK